MLKKEISFITDLNLNKLQSLGDHLTIQDINQSKIHPALIKYINTAIDKEIFLDRKKIEVDSIFDYSGDRINNYFNLISEEIKRTQNFDQKYIKQLLQDAVIFNANYLIKPNRTLTNFVFGQYDVKGIDEIIINVSHAHYYRYVQKILFTYFEKKKTLLMRRDEFVSLLNRIDQISKETHLQDSIITAINSIANYYDTDNRTSEKISLLSIKQYLREKKLPEFITKIEEKYGVENSSNVLVTELTSVITSVIPELEILIDNANKDENDFVEDQSYKTEVKEENVVEVNDFPEEKNDKNNEDFAETSSFDKHSLTELIDDESEIPNEEIISESNSNIEKISGEEFRGNGTDLLNNDEKINKQSEKKSEINDDNPQLNVNEELDQEQKKKPEVKSLLRKLINIDKLYQSYFKVPKPFDVKSEEINDFEILDKTFQETKYQIDLSTLSEDIEKPQVMVEEQSEPIYPVEQTSEKEEIDKVSLDRDLTKEEINYAKNAEDNIEVDEDLDRNYDEITESMDEIVNNASTDEEYNEEIVELKIAETEEEDNQKMENLIDEENLSLNEEGEELTEVFKDLTYLDGKDISEEIIYKKDDELNKNQEVDAENEKSDTEELDKDKSEKYQNFSEMILSKDMTKIIESVFDYDMEDYHTLISKISEADSETNALKILENYCQLNHIELSTEDVEEFKSFVSEFFTKAYS